MPERIIEAYVGEYASGKSENAINRALNLKSRGRKVKLVDLDLVEPFYTLRPIKKLLEDKGIEVAALNSREMVGLGETGSLLTPQMRWALAGSSDVILDVGYGIDGYKALNLIEGIKEEEKLKIFVVINVARPMTSSVEDIVEYVRPMGKVDGLINNSHLGRETSKEIIEEGAVIVTEAAKVLSVEVIATVVAKKYSHLIENTDNNTDNMDNPVKVIDLFMENAYW